MGIHTKSNALPRTVPHGLSDEGHLEAASKLTDIPFDHDPPLALSSRFAVDQCIEWGGEAKRHRQDKLSRISQKSRQLKPLTLKLVALMAETTSKVAAQCNLALILYMQILLGWADVRYVCRLIKGFYIVGAMDAPPIFRQTLRTKAQTTRKELLDTGKGVRPRVEEQGTPSGRSGCRSGSSRCL